MIQPIALIIFIFIGLRLNSCMERRLAARRILHGLVLPLYHYLDLLDHEMQSQISEVDPLYRQAALDHVTELRAFLLQPTSRDLILWGRLSWVNQLNNLLLTAEETLETEGDDIDVVELNAQVAHLLQFLKGNSYLNRLLDKPLGLVSIQN